MNTLYSAIPQTQKIPSKANNMIQIRVYIDKTFTSADIEYMMITTQDYRNIQKH